MDSKDIELKNALDEIFGDDIIELKEDIPAVEKKELTNEELFENTSTLVFNTSNIANANDEINKNEDNNIVDFEMSVVSEDITSENDNSELILNDFSIPVIDIKNDKKDENGEQLIIEDKDEEADKILLENQDNAVEESKINGTNNLENTVNKNIPAVKVVIISILVVLFTLTGVYFLANYNSNKEKVVNCSYSFNDKNYKITDEYKITYNSKKITYIEGIYIYTSKADEYDKQIKYIKEDKLPPIINSNGMKGFTYTYENTNDSIKIYSYLDYTIMDEEEINSIDQDIKPVSYFKVDLKSNSENLTDLFKKQGYKCVTSK